MPRKHQYFGGIIGGSPLVGNAPRTSGVRNLGSLSGDGALASPSPSLPSTPVYFLDGSVSGSTATSILSGNNATLGSGVSQVSGVGPKGNDVFRFTGGSTATYIKNTTITSMYGGLPYTFTAMVKAPLGGTDQLALLSKNSFYAATQTDFPFSIQISPAGVISCSLDSNDSDFASDYTLTSTGSVTSNTWTHVAVVADTSSVKIYLDGTLDTSGTHSVTLSSTSHAWTIGNHAAGAQTNLSAFNGDMTDIMFIDAALTAGDIENLYAAATPTQELTRPTRKWGGMLGRSLTTDVVKAPVVDHSLRFDGSADYLTRSQTTPTATTKWTWSGWAKLSTDSTAEQELLGGGPSGDQAHLSFIFNRLGVRRWYNAANVINTYTTQTFTDTSAWNHFVVAYDSTQGSVKIWVNGRPESLVAADGSSVVYPAANAVISLNKAGESHFIGRRAHSAAYWFNGQLAEVHFIDGTAYDASYFGETNANNQWVPKEVKGLTYGNNGFYLDFADSSTASTLGTDATTNGNDFTVPANTLTPDDQLLDSPNLRFATFDPSFSTGIARTLSEGNLWLTTDLNNFSPTGSTQPMSSGKYYAEFLAGDANRRGCVGVCEATYAFSGTDRAYQGSDNNVVMRDYDGHIYANLSAVSSNTVTITHNSTVIGVALDLDSTTKTVKWYLDGTLHYTYTLTSPPSMRFSAGDISGSYTAIVKANFGQDHTFAGTKSPLSSPYTDSDGNGEFYYQPPAGYRALTTKIVGSDTVLQSTGVISLAEHYQSKLFNPPPGDGLSAATAGDSAAQILLDYPTSGDGIYWINDDGTPKQVYCDMTNDGGGWMLYTSFATNSTYDATNYPAWNGNRIGHADMKVGGSRLYGWADNSMNGRDGTTSWGTGSGETQYTDPNDGPVYMFWDYQTNPAGDYGVTMTQWNGLSTVTELRVGWGKGSSSYNSANLGNKLLVNNGHSANSPQSSQSSTIEVVSFDPTGASGTPLLAALQSSTILGINGISSVWMR